MNMHMQTIYKQIGMMAGVLAAAAALIVAGCTAGNSVAGTSSSLNNTSTAIVPVTLTDAPSDQVVAASLTLNSIVLTDSKGATTSLLASPLSFEATHLDAVQEPLFTPAIPEGTYTSVSLTYSNAQVAYIDPTTKKVVLAAATLANTSQTITFASPIAVQNTMTGLLVDYLVAKSVAISGSTVTVTPQFNVTAVPIAAQPTNGLNGLLCGVKGKVTAVGTNQFTLTNPEGMSLTINVNTSTQYQGLSGFSALSAGMLVEVDIETQNDGSLLALRVEEQVPPNATAVLLVGPVTTVTGSPASTFTEVVRQKIGPAATAAAVETDTITVTGTTQFLLPGRYSNLTVGGLPFTPQFDASTLFAGQVVAVVAANGVTNNAATAQSVALAPQTVAGTITGIAAPTCSACWGQVTLTLPSGSWLATVTGLSTVTVYTNGKLQAINVSPAAAGALVRFNGFLFKNNGALVLLADVQADGPGNPIGPTP